MQLAKYFLNITNSFLYCYSCPHLTTIHVLATFHVNFALILHLKFNLKKTATASCDSILNRYR